MQNLREEKSKERIKVLQVKNRAERQQNLKTKGTKANQSHTEIR